jgi:CheY-like chemotaxis protein
MSKTVLDVGNCDLDHGAIRRTVERHFAARVLRAHGWEDCQQALRRGAVDLVLVNRRLDRDQSDGLEIIRRIKSDPGLATVPVMLISNFPQYQAAAEQAGALPGFGKDHLGQPAAPECLRSVLT